MAQLDIKNCNFYIADGYSGPGGTPVINHGGGYSLGATTIVVSGFTGILAVNDLFQISGDTSNKLYRVTAHSETGGNTTSITFTPALGASVADAAAITVAPHSLKIRIGEGNLTYTEKRPVTYVKDRGLLDTVRLGDQDPVEVKLDATWIFISSASGAPAPTIEEALKKAGAAANWVTSATDTCEPYAVDLIIEYTPPCTDNPELITIPDFRYEELGHDPKQGQISITGKCNVVQVNASRPSTLPVYNSLTG